MVEHVEKFRAEFELLLLVDRKLFDQRRVPLRISRAFNDIAPRVAECSQIRVVRKRARVEQCSRDAGLGIGISDQVGA